MNEKKQNASQERTASTIAAVFLVAILANFILSMFLERQTGDWQHFARGGVVFAFGIVTMIAMRLIRQGQAELGIWLILGGLLSSMISTALFLANFGLQLGLIAVLIVFTVVAQALPRKKIKWAMGLAILSGLVTYSLDFLSLTYRVPAPPIFTRSLSILAGMVIIILVQLMIRRAWSGSIRAKLIAAFVVISLVSLGTVDFFVTRSVQSLLETQIGNNFAARAKNSLTLTNDFFLEKVSQLYAQANDDTLRKALDERNLSYSGSQTQILAQIASLDESWIGAPANDPFILSIIADNPAINPAAGALADLLSNFPDHTELILTDRYGATVAATGNLSDYYQGDEEWWQRAWNGGEGALFISEPEYDESSAVTALLISLPIVEKNTGKPIGVLRSTLNVESLFAVLTVEGVGESGHTVLFDSNGEVIYDPRASVEDSSGLPIALRQEFVGKEAYFDVAVDQYGHEYIFGHARFIPEAENGAHTHAASYNESEERIADTVAELRWAAVFRQETEEAFAPVAQITRTILIVSAVIIALAMVFSLVIGQLLTAPVIRLTSVAEDVARGNLNVRAKVETEDEVGALAAAFNKMTAQLQDLIGTLEQRVADRTRAIETSAEIGRRLSAVLSQDELVRAVVEQLQKELGYYHVHIYLFDREHENLVMAGGSGEAGQKLLASGHSLPKGKGLVGRAGHLNATVLISDVSRNPEWLPNPLLPETKSEAAVPIAIQDEVLGVIDVQQNTVNGLSQADADLIASIASQVAVALQNARLFAQARRDAERKARLDAMGQEIQGAKSVEEALKISVRELGRALGAPRASVRLKSAALGTGGIPAQPEQDV